MTTVGKENESLTEMQIMELSVAHEFVLDNEDKPEDWEEQVDQTRLHTLRQEIIHWGFDELVAYCEALDVWDDPTKTKAVLEVIEAKTKV